MSTIDPRFPRLPVMPTPDRAEPAGSGGCAADESSRLSAGEHAGRQVAWVAGTAAAGHDIPRTPADPGAPLRRLDDHEIRALIASDPQIRQDIALVLAGVQAAQDLRALGNRGHA